MLKIIIVCEISILKRKLTKMAYPIIARKTIFQLDFPRGDLSLSVFEFEPQNGIRSML